MSEANRPAQLNSSDAPQGSGSPETASDKQDNVTSPQWKTVNFPGSLPLENLPVDFPTAAPRETELLNLIHDLNRCNEVLLGRVNQLEESLEAAHQALQAEVEHAQHDHGSAGQSVSIAQQHSTAQLLSELEGANDALKRQRILSETLQAQLGSSQERVTQLERECTLLQQQHTIKSQALQQSEETCRDLRSRLQRQQRYTLQFKVALEKCLDMSASPQGTSGFHGDGPSLADPAKSLGVGVQPQKHVSMPRADRIQPWSSDNSDPLADTQLSALLRAATLPHPTDADASPLGSRPETVAADSADAQLWQDLERIVDQAPPLTTAASPAPTAPVDADPMGRVEPQPSGFTEPMPWGPPQVKSADLSAPSPVDSAFPVMSEPAAVTHSAPSAPGMPGTTTWPPTNAAVPSSSTTDSTATIHVEPSTIDPRGHQVVIPEIPLLQVPTTRSTSPSPIVHPLRPQKKKLKSLSAVDLPSFPRPTQNVKAQ